MLYRMQHKIQLILDAVKFNLPNNLIDKAVNSIKDKIPDKYKEFANLNSLDELIKLLKQAINNKLVKIL